MNLSALISFRSLINGTLCCLLLVTFNNAQADDISFNETIENEIDITLFYDTLKNNLPKLSILENSNIYYGTDKFLDEYFTLRLNNTEKFKATYESGAYFINYSKNW